MQDRNKNQKTNEELFSAIKERKGKQEIARLIDAGADLASENQDKKTPMQVASSIDDYEAIEAIANKITANINDTYRYGDALLEVVKQKKYKTAEVLLKAKPSLGWITINDKNGCLHWAVKNNDAPMVALLVKNHANLNWLNLANQIPLVLACSLGYWDCAEALVADEKFEFKDAAQAAFALSAVIKVGRFDLVEKIINAGASLSTTLPPTGNTALHAAVAANKPDMVRFLLRKNANQTATNATGKTPIELASELGNWDCVQALIQHGNNNKEDKKLIEELHYENVLLNALKQNNYIIVELLLENNAPCDSWSSDKGNVPLNLAIQNNNPEMVSLLVKHGANPHQKNKDGKTSKDFASQFGFSKCVEAIQHFFSLDLMQQAEELFVSLHENNASAVELTKKVIGLITLHETILKAQVSELNQKRSDIKKTITKQGVLLAQSMDPNSELGKISVLISAMQSLLANPNKPASSYLLPNDDSPQVAYLFCYFQQKQMIDVYVTNVKNYLEKLSQDLEQTKFKVKNFWGMWVDGIPDHVKELKKILLKRNNAKTSQDFLEIYLEILNVYSGIKASKRRHPDTTNLYKHEAEEAQSVSLLTFKQFAFCGSAVFQSEFVPMQQPVAPSLQPAYPMPTYMPPAEAFPNFAMPEQPNLLATSQPENSSAKQALYPRLPDCSPYQPQTSITPLDELHTFVSVSSLPLIQLEDKTTQQRDEEPNIQQQVHTPIAAKHTMLFPAVNTKTENPGDHKLDNLNFPSAPTGPIRVPVPG